MFSIVIFMIILKFWIINGWSSRVLGEKTRFLCQSMTLCLKNFNGIFGYNYQMFQNGLYSLFKKKFDIPTFLTDWCILQKRMHRPRRNTIHITIDPSPRQYFIWKTLLVAASCLFNAKYCKLICVILKDLEAYAWHWSAQSMPLNLMPWLLQSSIYSLLKILKIGIVSSQYLP